MQNKRFFSKPLTFLIVAVLVITAFVKGAPQAWCLIGAFTISGIWAIGAAVWSEGKRFGRQRWKKPKSRKKKKTVNSGEFIESAVSDPVHLVLLRHVNHRISAHLKSAYPDITWEWVTEQPEQLIVEGGTGRIRLFNIPDFNYADVIFDQLARMNCDMLCIVPLAELRGVSGEDKAVREQSGQPVDPAVWYSLQGKSILDTCIADLHSHGHASLIIRESGDICIRQAAQEVICNNLKNFPGRHCWQSLVKVFEKDGLAASVLEGGIAISW